MKKLLACLLIVLTVLSLTALSGCSKDNNPVATNMADFNEKLVAEKVGSMERTNFTTADGGLYYKEGDLYGIMSLNGRYDTGAKYLYCGELKNYFEVSNKKANHLTDYAALNSVALVDGKGKTLIPAIYAKYYVLSERFVCAYTVNSLTTIDEYLTSIPRGRYNFEPEELMYYYDGSWVVYDIIEGKMVKGAAGTKNKYPTANGKYLSFITDDDKRVVVKTDGTALPEGATVFEDGSYKIEEKDGTVYDVDGKKLFTYLTTDFIPSTYSDGYYIATKYVDGKTKYVVMDKTGKKVSAEFDDYITLYGELIYCAKKVYNFDGKTVIDGEYASMWYDKFFSDCWMLHNDKVFTMILKDGSVIYQAKDGKDDISVFSSYWTAKKEKDDGNYFYSHKDKDYTIKGYNAAPWLIETPNANSLYDMVDSISGEVLFQGYSSYKYCEAGGTSLYIYASHNAGTDIYQILSLAQLATIGKKKADMISELVAAFKAEGINVTVNEETGEMAMDASVLFGGDSAVLTAEGKSFLNKFTKAYTSIVFSEKYDGFVAKTLVEGHIAPVAGSTYDSGLSLSKERANNVKGYCLSKETGVNTAKLASSLEAIGYSNTQPIYKSNGDVDMAASRRVSFRFMLNID